MRAKYYEGKTFEEKIKDEKWSIGFLENKLESGEVKKEAIPMVKSGILQDIHTLLSCMYSNGDSLSEIRGILEENFKYIYEYWTPKNICRTIDFTGGGVAYHGEAYYKFIGLISLCLVLNLDKTYFEKLKECNDRFKNDDILLNFLIEYGRTGEKVVAGSRKAYGPYDKLYELFDVETDEEKEKILIKYTKLWLRGHNGYYFHDNHESPGSYFGYWAFESSALAKIFSLTTKDLSKIEYFPRDLYEKN